MRRGEENERIEKGENKLGPCGLQGARGEIFKLGVWLVVPLQNSENNIECLAGFGVVVDCSVCWGPENICLSWAMGNGTIKFEIRLFFFTYSSWPFGNSEPFFFYFLFSLSCVSQLSCPNRGAVGRWKKIKKVPTSINCLLAMLALID